MKARIAAVLRERAAWLVPLVVAAIAMVPALYALRAQTFAILGRDQGIFMFVAWALRHGERIYRDVHEINGPLPHAYYAFMQALGGEDEHVFRVLDTTWLGLGYAFVGATLPRWVGLPVTRRTTAAWALAGLAVMGAQYTRYEWWHTAQREGIYAVLVAASLGCQAIAHTTRSRRTAIAAFAAASVLTTLPWFGKPPCALFGLLQVFVVLLDRRSIVASLRAVMVVAVASGLAVGASALGFVLAFEDLGAGLRLLAKVPQLHHTIWNETLLGAYRAYNNAPRLDWAMATTAAFLGAFFWLRLPRRSLLALVLPLGGLVVFAGQGKAFPYHLHMLTLGTAVTELVLLASLVRALERRHDVLVVVAGLAAGGLGFQAAEDALMSHGVRGGWAAAGATAELRTTRAYLDHFPWGDYFPADLREAGAYLDAQLLPDERIQTYGFDPYLLFFARRKSASPVIYNFELNVDAALEGGPGARPSPELWTWLETYRDDAEALVLAHVQKAPPAAFAIVDEAPFTHPRDGEVDFRAHCPQLWAFMTARYVRSAAFGAVKVWLREDVATRAKERAPQ